MKPIQALMIVVVGYVALLVGLAFIFWPVALVVGGSLLMVGGSLLIDVETKKPLDAAPLDRIPNDSD